MLKDPTPFPQVGSYALRVHDNKTSLVRIQARERVGDEDVALLSHPGTTGSSGNSKVALCALLDGTPLDAAEIAEFRALDTKRQRAALRGKDKGRLTALALRRIYAPLLSELMISAGLATRELNTESAAA